MPKQKRETFADLLRSLKEQSATVRPVETIEERQYYLIVCEGTRTEPIYFNHLRNFLPKNFLDTVVIDGAGANTINVVQRAIEKRNERLRDQLLPPYDQVWAVFDKDDFAAERFNEAIELAAREGINCAFSNQSFELWYVLHFQYLVTALNRTQYIDILSKHLGFKYEKNSPKVVQLLFDKCDIPRAINWARQLEELHIGNTPSNSCPLTRVYLLVENLLKYSKHESLKI